MIQIKEYKKEYEDNWDDFVKNSTSNFLQFYRRYLEYHSHKFKDNSLMFFYKSTLIALLPANTTPGFLYSHQGLTFGGLVCKNGINSNLIKSCLKELYNYCREKKIKTLLYKILPYFYHNHPPEADLYFLINHGARIEKAELTSTINLKHIGKLSSRRKRGIKKSKEFGLEFKPSSDWKEYWDILEHTLQRKHGTLPTHSLEEILYLQNKLPNNIKLFGAYHNNIMLAGVVIYYSNKVAHAQYIANSEKGMKVSALDGLFFYLISLYSDSPEIEYFDFGISTEDSGKTLNTGLVKYKEEFGSTPTTHLTLSLDID